jgi:hypothetical protein
MKDRVLQFIVAVMTGNCVLTFLLCLVLSNGAQLIFMVILFTPTIIQIVGSIFFLLIVVPFRNLTQRTTAVSSNSDIISGISTFSA